VGAAAAVVLVAMPATQDLHTLKYTRVHGIVILPKSRRPTRHKKVYSFQLLIVHTCGLSPRQHSTVDRVVHVLRRQPEMNAGAAIVPCPQASLTEIFVKRSPCCL
jgi:hypothetical protein